MWFSEVGMDDVHRVGGKNASLGEMIQNLTAAGVNIPPGFATSADAFRHFLASAGLTDLIERELTDLDVTDVEALAVTGARIRAAIVAAPFPESFEKEIRDAYQTLGAAASENQVSWAVRSSATAEDLPDASFAGQQETFLNVSGIDNILVSVKEVFASLYNDRAIAYRVHHGFTHADVAISAGVQRMVRSDLAASGVMFTMDTETGFQEAVFITSSYGLGEAVVQGAVNPDEFYVYKPGLREGRPAILKRGLGEKAVQMVYAEAESGRNVEFTDVPAELRDRFSISDDEIHELARQALKIEQHYGRPMDIEWGKDGSDGRLYILQARPETVQSRQPAGLLTRYRLLEQGEVLLEGRAIGQRIGAGTVRVLGSLENMSQFQPGEVLVADMTDPDWEPIMKRASAIVTNRGGRTCHAAIIARELGIPAIVGTGNATTALSEGTEVTVSCASGETGLVFEGKLDFEIEENTAEETGELPTKIMMNVGTPEQAFSFARLPHAGVGLARLEFIINRQIGIHPKVLLAMEESGPGQQPGIPENTMAVIRRRMAAYAGPRDYYIQRLAEGIATLGAAFAPHPVIIRLSDFKSNEYANLLGGNQYEPEEENPMIGFRGAARYVSSDFQAAFELECEAVKYVRDIMGLTNIKLMIPFVRTVPEARAVVDLLAANGLNRGAKGLEVIMMCELPVNALMADEFLEHFDGFSIGSNDLTQLTLGLDRDSALVADSFDERNQAVKHLISLAIQSCKAQGKYVGICGQGPSDHPDFAEWLVAQGIDSLSLNPDSVVETRARIAAIKVKPLTTV
nr:phosphoenolpyruvate synthase [Pseudarthrobacter sp. GA104]